LKYLETIFDDMPDLARRRPAPAARERVSIDLDEDLFFPAGAKPSGSPSAPAEQSPAASVDLDPRPWPTLDLPPQPDANPLEKKVADQQRELLQRCTQVADLYNLQERQAAELQVAYAEIERLNAAFSALQKTATQHAMAAAERKKAMTALHQENAILRSKLEKALDDSADMAQRMLTVETLFNDRELVVTTALEQADLLKAELAAAGNEKTTLSAEIEDARQLHRDDASRKTATIDELSRKVESLFVDHGIQLKTRDKLAKRCDELAKTVAILDSANEEARNRLAAEGEHTTFLETVLRVERESADAKIRELAEKLEHQVQQRAIADRASAAMRREMAALLRQFAAQRQRGGGGEPEVPGSQQNAA
jgi:chromosome segregation ATPase